MNHGLETYSRFTKDELSPLNPSPIVAIKTTNDPSTTEDTSNCPSQTARFKSHQRRRLSDSSKQYEIFMGAAMILTSALINGINDIRKLGDVLGTPFTPYIKSTAEVLISECGKFMVSGLLLCTTEGISGAISSLQTMPIKQWLLLSLPAAIYFIDYNLIFYTLQYMDPDSMQVRRCMPAL